MVESGRGQGKTFPRTLHAILWKPPSSFSGYTPGFLSDRYSVSENDGTASIEFGVITGSLGTTISLFFR